MPDPGGKTQPGARSFLAPQWWPHRSELPRWEVWLGSDGAYVARLADSQPTVIVRGKDPADLRRQIRQTMLRALL